MDLNTGKDLKPEHLIYAREKEESPITEDAEAAPRQLIIADRTCPGINSLLTGALHELLTLKHSDNPLLSITRALKSKGEENAYIDTLHIIAHGNAEGFQLCNQQINENLLDENEELLTQWGVRTIALWSCETGKIRS